MYLIMSKSKFGTDVIDEAETKKEAQYLRQEYKFTLGVGYLVTIKQKRKRRK